MTVHAPSFGLTGYDEFAGFGGTSQGMKAAGIDLKLAANHAKIAVEVHALNYPDVDHYLGDVTKADLTIFPRVDIFGISPSCPAWSDARGATSTTPHRRPSWVSTALSLARRAPTWRRRSAAPSWRNAPGTCGRAPSGESQSSVGWWRTSSSAGSGTSGDAGSGRSRPSATRLASSR